MMMMAEAAGTAAKAAGIASRAAGTVASAAGTTARAAGKAASTVSDTVKYMIPGELSQYSQPPMYPPPMYQQQPQDNTPDDLKEETNNITSESGFGKTKLGLETEADNYFIDSDGNIVKKNWCQKHKSKCKAIVWCSIVFGIIVFIILLLLWLFKWTPPPPPGDTSDNPDPTIIYQTEIDYNKSATSGTLPTIYTGTPIYNTLTKYT